MGDDAYCADAGLEESVPARTRLSLALLVLCVFADDPHNTLAVNHLALDANLLD